MTYSYVHRAINREAFPKAAELYDKELMTGRGGANTATVTMCGLWARNFSETSLKSSCPACRLSMLYNAPHQILPVY